MGKRINPRRIPCTRADVDRAKDIAVGDACRLCWAIMFTVLRDKCRYSNDQLSRMWSNVNKLSSEIAEGRISVNDLIRTLKDEADIDLTK